MAKGVFKGGGISPFIMSDAVEVFNAFPNMQAHYPWQMHLENRIRSQDITVFEPPYYERDGYTYMPRNAVSRNENYIDKYKIYISKAYGAGEGFPHQIINIPVIGETGTICSGTYLVVGPFEDRGQTINALNYMKTKFFRSLVLINKISQDSYAKVYDSVPMQDFSKPWTDTELYEKYGLTDEEIAFIESMIKPM